MEAAMDNSKLRLATIWLRIGVALLISTVVMLVLACNESDDGEEDGSANGDPSPEADATASDPAEIITFEDVLEKDPAVTQTEELDWGWMFEETGVLSGFGVPAGDGALMAVEEINAAGGFQVGDTLYTINLIRRDTRSDVAQTIAVTQELIQDAGVNVIWGPASFGDPEATVITQQAGILHLCPCPQREISALTSEEEVQETFPYAFQTIPAPSRFLPPGALNARQEYPQFDTFATLCANSETGRTFCNFFKEAYLAAGFEHVGEELFPSETTDFSPFLTNLKQNDPDIILNFVDAGPEQLTLLRRSWELDVGEFYIAVELPYEIFEGLVGEGIREKIVSAGAAPRGHAQYTSEDARIFFEDKYKAFKPDLPPAAFAALLTYDPVYMLAAAMQRAGTVDDVEAIAQALREVHFDGLGEDDTFFDSRNIIITGNDSCEVYQGLMECTHHPPPPVEE
jgi:ABC-type branched-subunit amino acid transport system substrate-binding protein